MYWIYHSLQHELWPHILLHCALYTQQKHSVKNPNKHDVLLRKITDSEKSMHILANNKGGEDVWQDSIILNCDLTHFIGSSDHYSAYELSEINIKILSLNHLQYVKNTRSWTTFWSKKIPLSLSAENHKIKLLGLELYILWKECITCIIYKEFLSTERITPILK